MTVIVMVLMVLAMAIVTVGRRPYRQLRHRCLECGAPADEYRNSTLCTPCRIRSMESPFS